MALMVLGGQWALAASSEGVRLALDVLKVERTYDDGTNTAENKVTDLDIRLGYIMSNRIYLGAIQSTTNYDSSDVKRTALGASVGFFADAGFYFMGHYFVSGEYDVGASKYTNGSGTELDIGYTTQVSSNFSVGVLLALKNFSYKKLESGSTSTDVTYKISEMLPMLGVAFNF